MDGKADDADTYLAVLESLLANQAESFNGLEAQVLEHVWRARAIARPESTNAVFSALSSQLSPIFLLAGVASTLRDFIAGKSYQPAGHGFALVCLGRTLLQLPREVVEEELPRLRDLLLDVSHVIGRLLL